MKKIIITFFFCLTVGFVYSQNEKETVSIDFDLAKNLLHLGNGFDINAPRSNTGNPFLDKPKIDSTPIRDQGSLNFYMCKTDDEVLQVTSDEFKLGLGFWMFKAGYEKSRSYSLKQNSSTIVIVARRVYQEKREFLVDPHAEMKPDFQPNGKYGTGKITSVLYGNILLATIKIQIANQAYVELASSSFKGDVSGLGADFSIRSVDAFKKVCSSENYSVDVTVETVGEKSNAETRYFPELDYKSIMDWINNFEMENRALSAEYEPYLQSIPIVKEAYARQLFDNYCRISSDLEIVQNVLLGIHSTTPKNDKSLLSELKKELETNKNEIEKVYKSYLGSEPSGPPQHFNTIEDILAERPITARVYLREENGNETDLEKLPSVDLKLNALNIDASNSNNDFNDTNKLNKIRFEVKGPFLKSLKLYYSRRNLPDDLGETLRLHPGTALNPRNFNPAAFDDKLFLVSDLNKGHGSRLKDRINRHHHDTWSNCRTFREYESNNSIWLVVTDVFGREEFFDLVRIKWKCTNGMVGIDDILFNQTTPSGTSVVQTK